jgi:hypothetical protein
MSTANIHISRITIDTPIHVVSDFYKNSIAPLKSVFNLKAGVKCYVPSGRGGVLPVTCKSIDAGVITLCDGTDEPYVIDLHAPVMNDETFTSLYNSINSKHLNKSQRHDLYVGEKQGYINIQSHTQYGLSKTGWKRAKQLNLY